MAGHATHQPIEVLEHGLVNKWLKLTKHGATRNQNTVSNASLPDPVLPEKTMKARKQLKSITHQACWHPGPAKVDCRHRLLW